MGEFQFFTVGQLYDNGRLAVMCCSFYHGFMIKRNRLNCLTDDICTECFRKIYLRRFCDSVVHKQDMDTLPQNQNLVTAAKADVGIVLGKGFFLYGCITFIEVQNTLDTSIISYTLSDNWDFVQFIFKIMQIFSIFLETTWVKHCSLPFR